MAKKKKLEKLRGKVISALGEVESTELRTVFRNLIIYMIGSTTAYETNPDEEVKVPKEKPATAPASAPEAAADSVAIKLIDLSDISYGDDLAAAETDVENAYGMDLRKVVGVAKKDVERMKKITVALKEYRTVYNRLVKVVGTTDNADGFAKLEKRAVKAGVDVPAVIGRTRIIENKTKKLAGAMAQSALTKYYS